MVGGEHYLKSLALQLLWLGNEGVLKIYPQRMTYSIIQLFMDDKCVCRTALATPGLLTK